MDGRIVLRNDTMKTITVRLPGPIAAYIEAQARRRWVSKSQIVRAGVDGGSTVAAPMAGIADLIGAIEEGLPTDISSRKKYYLRVRKYGRKRDR